MAVISNLSVSLTANTKGLTRGLNRAKKQVKNFTNSVFNIKSALIGALGVGSIGAIVKSSLTAWETQQFAVTSLDASIKSMGRTTEGLSGKLQKLASQIQGEGIIGDEALIQGQSFLTTYSQISDKMLPRATRAMADLTAKTGASTQSIANLIGKAAMGDVGALKRYGITMSDASLKTKDFGLILTDIESQVGGTNKALGATASGAMIQFSNAAGDMREKLGEIVAIGIAPWMRQLSQELGSTEIDAKRMGETFKDSMLSAAQSVAPFLDVMNGISLVIKTLKMGFMGFGLLITGTMRNAAYAVKSFGDHFGMDIGETAFATLDESYNKQLSNIATLKSEWFGLVDDLSNETASKDFLGKINGFNQKATVGDMKSRLGLPTEGGTFRPVEKSIDPQPINAREGISRPIIIIEPSFRKDPDRSIAPPVVESSFRKDQDRSIDKSAVFTKIRGIEKNKINPQINRTNDLLMKIHSSLNSKQYAVAG